jgi:hypothetical protein
VVQPRPKERHETCCRQHRDRRYYRGDVGRCRDHRPRRNGVVTAQNNTGFVQYIDAGDKVKVCDTKKNDDGVIGWIAVRQTSGKYKNYPRIYVGGAGKCVTRTQDVTPENTSIILTACSVSGVKGTPYACGSKIIKGN